MNRTRIARFAAAGSALAVAAALAAPLAGPATATPTPVVVPHAQPNPAHLLPQGYKIGPAKHKKSLNWAGYVDKGKGYHVIRSTWRQPKVTCTSKTALAAFWVGIDGYTSGTVEQDGSLAYCYKSKVHYYTWWEMYPKNNVQIVGTTVKPGDVVTSWVIRKGAHYTLKVIDHTHPANSFTKKTTCKSCKNSSAEWIAERPSGSGGLYPLAKFSKVVFFGNYVGKGKKKGSISKFSHDSLTMVNNKGKVLCSASKLAVKGKQFTAIWHQMN